MNILKTTALVLGTIGVAGATAFSIDTKVSADTTNTLQVSNYSNSANANQLLSSKIQMMNDTGGPSGGRWEYQYTAQPYAFFYNRTTKKWKMVQVTSYTEHTVNVIVNGYMETYDRWVHGDYAPRYVPR